MELEFSPEEIGAVFEKAAGLQDPNESFTVFLDSSGKDKVVQYVTLGDSVVHNPAAGNKTETEGDSTPVDVEIKTVYNLLTFEDRFEEDELIAQIFAALPGILAKAPFQLIAGYSKDQAGTPIASAITETAVVDGTIASWVAAAETVEDEGWALSKWNLDNRAKSLVRSANTNSFSTLSTVSTTGAILEAPASYTPKLASAGEYGWAGDRDGNILVIQPSISSEIHMPQDNWSLRLQNKIGVYVGVRLGVTSLPGAAVRLVAAAS